jgi:hypothetical protein
VATQIQADHETELLFNQLEQQFQVTEFPIQHQGPLAQQVFGPLKGSTVVQVA